MNFKRSTLAAMIAGALAVGISGQASAYIYGGASMDVSGLTIGIFNNDGTLATINNFDFQTQTTSNLNGTDGPTSTKACSGLPGTANSCNSTGVGPVLNSLPSSIGISRTDNSFTLLGPTAGGEFGSADNVIWQSELVGTPGANPTHVQGIAEAQISSGTNAGSSSNIRSTTGYTFTFEVGPGGGSFVMTFDANAYTYAQNIDPTTLAGTASATSATQFTLTGAGESVLWEPSGLGAGSSVTTCSGGVVCSVTNDTQNLNYQASAPFGSTDSGGPDGSLTSLFGLSLTDLAEGTYSFTISTTQTVNVTRFAAPEPGTLLLLGSSVLGIGLTRRFKGRRA
jgi:hypothetical protein